MLEFKKYNSIDNSFEEKFMSKVRLEMPHDLQYVVQEKVHGTNVSFICDGKEVKFAKRTAFVSVGENFYDYEELLERYHSKVLELFAKVKEQYPQMIQMTLFGEMFGGLYPHSEVLENKSVRLIQQGVYYTPNHELYCFDILVVTETENFFLSVEDANTLFESEKLFYAKTLFKGSLDECLDYPNAFPTKVAEWLGFPAINDNICEGVVIRPVVPKFFRNGSRVLIKNKNERFSEKKKGGHKGLKLPKVKMNDAVLQPVLEEMELYITENRLNNVLSHIGEVDWSKDVFMVMGALSKDVLVDFMKEHGELYDALEKKEQKQLNKKLNDLALNLVKKRSQA